MPVSAVNIPPAIQSAITNAGNRSGVDFDYLLTTAIRESSLDPNARAGTSSATGLFQFLSDTWLETVKEEGEALGYGDIAKHIERTGDHTYEVRDPALRRQVLALRTDPAMSADMAAAFTRRNGEHLRQAFGRQPSPGELYIAHFMGARGAEAFFQHGLSQPDANAANLFPRQAKANPAIFYKGGEARSVREVYQVLTRKHKAIAAQPAVLAAQQMSQSQSQQVASPVTSQAVQAAVRSVGLADTNQPPLPRLLMSDQGRQSLPATLSAYANTVQMLSKRFGEQSGEAPPAPRILMTKKPDAAPE